MIALTESTGQRTRRTLSVAEALTDAELRLYDAIPESMFYVPHASFSSAQTEHELFGEQAEEVEIPLWRSFPAVPREDVSARRTKRVNLSARDETRLLLRCNYARFRLSPLIEAQRKRKTIARAKEMVLWFRRAMDARAGIVQANLPLVAAMAKRTTVRNVERAELIGEGNMALVRSVDKFDVSRGFRFSTYACRAILKSFSRVATKTSRYRKAFPIEYDPELDPSDYDVKKHEMQHQEAIDSLKESLALNRANLTRLERTVLRERYGLGGTKPRTLADVGRIVGLTSERVRQIQNLVLCKIRWAAEACPLVG